LAGGVLRGLLYSRKAGNDYFWTLGRNSSLSAVGGELK